MFILILIQEILCFDFGCFENFLKKELMNCLTSATMKVSEKREFANAKYIKWPQVH